MTKYLLVITSKDGKIEYTNCFIEASSEDELNKKIFEKLEAVAEFQEATINRCEAVNLKLYKGKKLIREEKNAGVELR